MRVRVCGLVGVRMGVRMGVRGRACLRFKRVLRRPVGEPGGGFQGSLFAGNDMIAERGQRAFKRVFCTLWVRIRKRGAKGRKLGRTRCVKARKGAPFRRRPYSALRLVVYWFGLSVRIAILGSLYPDTNPLCKLSGILSLCKLPAP